MRHFNRQTSFVTYWHRYSIRTMGECLLFRLYLIYPLPLSVLHSKSMTYRSSIANIAYFTPSMIHFRITWPVSRKNRQLGKFICIKYSITSTPKIFLDVSSLQIYREKNKDSSTPFATTIGIYSPNESVYNKETSSHYLPARLKSSYRDATLTTFNNFLY